MKQVNLRRLLRLVVALALSTSFMVSCGGGGEAGQPESTVPVASGARTLNVQPIAQQTQVWCWAAAAEMVFRHYGLPALNSNFQCGVVAAYFGGVCLSNCFNCVAPIGSMSQMQTLIDNYGNVARLYGPSRVLSSRLLFGALAFDQVAAEINAGRPVLAGISPGSYSYPNFSLHVVLVVGYDASGGTPRLIVNDPFPYEAFPAQLNPYFAVGATRPRSGQYSILYRQFVSPMNWGNTIYGIQ